MALRDIILIIVLVIIAVTILVSTNFGAGTTVIYDCRIAEFHPDYPVEVKQECRKLIKDSNKITT
jgi:hypothetical protein